MKDRKFIVTTTITLILIAVVICVLIISAGQMSAQDLSDVDTAEFDREETLQTLDADGITAAAATVVTTANVTTANAAATSVANTNVTTANVTAGGMIDATELFTERDLTQTPDLTDAVYYTVQDGEDIHITEEGIYVFSGEAAHMTIYVDAPEAKVQLVLNGVSITNDNFPCIYITDADKVFITSLQENRLTVSNGFLADGNANTDGVIFSKDDLTLNGTGTLTISSSQNGIVSKDDLKITGGTYQITADAKALEAHDSIRVCAGTLTLTAGTDALHAENSADDTLGYVYICGGDFTINAGDDGIHAVSIVQIDGGSFYINAAEGIEATCIQINGGSIAIQASDDGINAARKSGSYYPAIEINNGSITVVMGAGDTDGIDSNGDIIVNGGSINVTGNSTFDYDGSAQYNGGTIIVNGQQVDSIPNQMMGGRGGGDMGVSRGGRGW